MASEEQNMEYLKKRIEYLEAREVDRQSEFSSIEKKPRILPNHIKEQTFLDENPLDLMNINFSVVLLLRAYEEHLEKTIKKTPLILPSNEALNKAFNVEAIKYWDIPKDWEEAYARGCIKGAQYIININK